MEKAAIVLVILASLSGSVLAGDVDRLERADSPARVEALAKRILPFINAGYDDYRRTEALALAFERVGRSDRGAAILRQKREKFDAGKQDCLRDLEAKILIRAERYDDALAVARARFSAARDHKARWIAHRQIALCLEKKKDWAGALGHYLEKRGRTGCGTCNEFIARLSARDIARCRFFSGDVDRALEELAALLVRPEDQGGPFIGVSVFYCDYSARAGRSAAARKLIATLPPERRVRMSRQMDLADAFVAKDFKRVVAIFEDPANRIGLPWNWAAARFVELGAPGSAAIAGRIEAGSEVLIILAGHTGCTDLLPAIERRLWIEEDIHLLRNLENARNRIIEDGGYRARVAADLARAKCHLVGMADAVARFRLERGSWPRRLLELTVPIEDHPDGILRRIPRDPWGGKYTYRRPGKAAEKPVLTSRGPDRKAGTSDDVTLP